MRTLFWQPDLHIDQHVVLKERVSNAGAWRPGERADNDELDVLGRSGRESHTFLDILRVRKTSNDPIDGTRRFADIHTDLSHLTCRHEIPKPRYRSFKRIDRWS